MYLPKKDLPSESAPPIVFIVFIRLTTSLRLRTQPISPTRIMQFSTPSTHSKYANTINRYLITLREQGITTHLTTVDNVPLVAKLSHVLTDLYNWHNGALDNRTVHPFPAPVRYGTLLRDRGRVLADCVANVLHTFLAWDEEGVTDSSARTPIVSLFFVGSPRLCTAQNGHSSLNVINVQRGEAPYMGCGLQLFRNAVRRLDHYWPARAR